MKRAMRARKELELEIIRIRGLCDSWTTKEGLTPASMERALLVMSSAIAVLEWAAHDITEEEYGDAETIYAISEMASSFADEAAQATREAESSTGKASDAANLKMAVSSMMGLTLFWTISIAPSPAEAMRVHPYFNDGDNSGYKEMYENLIRGWGEDPKDYPSLDNRREEILARKPKRQPMNDKDVPKGLRWLRWRKGRKGRD